MQPQTTLERSTTKSSLQQQTAWQVLEQGRLHNRGKVISLATRFFYISINRHGHGVLPITSMSGRPERNGPERERKYTGGVQMIQQTAELAFCFDRTERNRNVNIFTPPTVYHTSSYILFSILLSPSILCRQLFFILAPKHRDTVLEA